MISAGGPDPTDLTPSFQQLDRIVTGQGVVSAATAETIATLQKAASPNRPCTLAVASALRELVEDPVALFTGFVVPDRFPHGENDGPLGAVALARALRRIGVQPELLVDPPLVDTVRWLVAEIDADTPVTAITAKTLAASERFAAAVAVEKPGRNERGFMHTYDGQRIVGGSPAIDDVILRMNEAGLLTVSIADRGNEVGFGGLRDLVCELIPDARVCSCGCGGRIAAATPATLLLPAAVSNWGAYGVVAGLALLTERPDLALLPGEEERMLKVAAVRGCRDGVRRRGLFGVDGVPGDASVRLTAQLAQVLREIGVSSPERSQDEVHLPEPRPGDTPA